MGGSELSSEIVALHRFPRLMQEYLVRRLSAMLPGVLREFDLPDVYRALESKNLRLFEPWDGMDPAP